MGDTVLKIQPQSRLHIIDSRRTTEPVTTIVPVEDRGNIVGRLVIKPAIENFVQMPPGAFPAVQVPFQPAVPFLPVLPATPIERPVHYPKKWEKSSALDNIAYCIAYTALHPLKLAKALYKTTEFLVNRVTVLAAASAIVGAGFLYGHLPDNVSTQRDRAREIVLETLAKSKADDGYNSLVESIKHGPKLATTESEKVSETIGRKGIEEIAQYVPRLLADAEKDSELKKSLLELTRKLVRYGHSEAIIPFFEGTTKTNPVVKELQEAAADEESRCFVQSITDRPGFEGKVYDKVYGFVKPEVGNALRDINSPANLNNPVRYVTKPAREASLDAITDSLATSEQKGPVLDWLAEQGEGLHSKFIEGKEPVLNASEKKGADAVNTALKYGHEALQKVLQQHKGEILTATKGWYLYNRGDRLIVRVMKTGLEATVNDVLGEWATAEVNEANIAIDTKNFRLTSDTTIEVDINIAQGLVRKSRFLPSFIATGLGFLDTSKTYNFQDSLNPSNEPVYRQEAFLADTIVREAMYREREVVRKPDESELAYHSRKEDWQLEISGMRKFAADLYTQASKEIMNLHSQCPHCNQESEEGCVAQPVVVEGKTVRAAPWYHARTLSTNAAACLEEVAEGKQLDLQDIEPTIEMMKDAKNYEQIREKYIELKPYAQSGEPHD